MKRLIAAFILAPLVPALPFLIFALILCLSNPSLQSLTILFGVWLATGVVTYPVAWILGIPLYLWFRRYAQFQRLPYYLIVGGLLGIIQFLVLHLIGGGKFDDSMGMSVFMTIFFALCGILVAAVFWWMTKSLRNKPVTIAIEPEKTNA